MALIKERKIVSDDWRTFADGEDVAEGAAAIVSMKRFLAEGADLRQKAAKIGVRLSVDDAPEDLAPSLGGVALVAVEFPKYVDGRGYSTARILRERYGFDGELRAVGNVLRDQLQYMERCGFDAFELEEGKDAEAALDAFGEISVAYQGATDPDLPLYRRR